MFEVKEIGQLMAKDFPDQEYIVDRLIPASSIAILSGQSRSFKTYTLLEIALAAAKGEPLFGQFNTQKTGVLIIDEENGERLMQKRLKQLHAAEDLPIYVSSFGGFQLDDSHIDQVLDFCSENNIGLVIIDALIRVHGADENSARDMSKVFQKLRSFTKKDVAILVTQHHRKMGTMNTGAGNEMRGSSDILAAVDSHVGVSRKEKFYLTFTQEKQRYDVELDPFQVKVNVDEDNFSFEYLGVFRRPPEKSAILLPAVVDLLTEHKQLRQIDLLEKLTERSVATNEHDLRKLLNRWVAEGALPQPTKGRGSSKYYWLEEQPDE
jgi:archaellum biogenesis ATPase FlaH